MTIIPYNLNIPLATNSPSVDQPNMKANTNSIAQFVAVDHVAFETAGSGQHNQVTFNANNVPSSPVNPPVLFTNNAGGPTVTLPQLFFYSGSAANGANQYVAAANGSTFLLGGIILKWGNSAVIGTQSFVSAFPNNCFNVIVIGTATPYSGTFIVTAVSPSGFTVARGDGHSGITGYYYMAVGN